MSKKEMSNSLILFMLCGFLFMALLVSLQLIDELDRVNKRLIRQNEKLLKAVQDRNNLGLYRFDMELDHDFPTSNEYAAKVTSFYMDNRRRNNYHQGIDIVIGDDLIYNTKPGIVKDVYYSKLYGNVLEILHNDSITLYKHCERITVEKGQPIEYRQVVAIQGDTGTLSRGPHLHYEIQAVFSDNYGEYALNVNPLINDVVFKGGEMCRK